MVIGAGAKVLGSFTIGDGARIGAGSVVINEVPAGATVVGVSGRISKGGATKKSEILDHEKLPDPVADAIRFVWEEQDKIEDRIAELESKEGIFNEIDDYLEIRKRAIWEEFSPWAAQYQEGGGI